MIKLVIFDMAGTSIDEGNLVYKTIQSVLNGFGIDVSLEQVLETGAGKEKRRAISDIIDALGYDDVTEDVIDEMHAAFKIQLDAAYKTAPMEVFPSVREVIHFLKENHIKVAFNTGYSRAVASGILDRVNVEIDGLCTASDVKGNRPDPDMIDYLCDQLDIPCNQTIKIGDSAIDIEEGQNAGVLFSIGITTGAQNRSQLAIANPNFIYDDMKEIIPLIEAENSLG